MPSQNCPTFLRSRGRNLYRLGDAYLYSPKLGRPEDGAASKGWLHEFKFDGFRFPLHTGQDPVIYSRNGSLFTKRFRALVPTLAEMPPAINDADLVDCDGNDKAGLSRAHVRLKEPMPLVLRSSGRQDRCPGPASPDAQDDAQKAFAEIPAQPTALS